MKQRKFSTDQRVCNEMLSSFYQRIEGVQKLESKYYSQIEYYNKPHSAQEWLSGRITYNNKNQLLQEEWYNVSGELVKTFHYQHYKDHIIAKSKEETSTWWFNESNILVKEIHEFDFDQPDIYEFRIDDNNRLVSINDKIQLIWKDNEPIKLVNYESLNILKEVITRSELESKIQDSETNEMITIKYNEYGSMVERETGDRKTSINYFGYDMMQGTKVTTVVNGQITYMSYSEEKLISNKTVEKTTDYYNNGNDLSRTLREIKTRI